MCVLRFEDLQHGEAEAEIGGDTQKSNSDCGNENNNDIHGLVEKEISQATWIVKLSE